MATIAEPRVVSVYQLANRTGISAHRLRKACAQELIPVLFVPVSTDRYRVLSVRAEDAPRLIDAARKLPSRRRTPRKKSGLCPACGNPIQRT